MQCAGWHGETQFHSDEDEILNSGCFRAVLHLQVAKRLERALWGSIASHLSTYNCNLTFLGSANMQSVNNEI